MPYLNVGQDSFPEEVVVGDTWELAGWRLSGAGAKVQVSQVSRAGVWKRAGSWTSWVQEALCVKGFGL